MWPLVAALFFFQAADPYSEGMKALEDRKYEAAVEAFNKALAADPFYRLEKELDDTSLSLEEEQKLASVLRRLSDEQREVVVLRDLVGMTFREITRVTGSPLGSVASRYRYGMAKLRAMAAPTLGRD